MFQVLIAIMMSLGIKFTTSDKGQIQISSSDMTVLQSSTEFQKLGTDANNGITINDGVDPESAANDKE